MFSMCSIKTSDTPLGCSAANQPLIWMELGLKLHLIWFESNTTLILKDIVQDMSNRIFEWILSVRCSEMIMNPLPDDELAALMNWAARRNGAKQQDVLRLLNRTSWVQWCSWFLIWKDANTVQLTFKEGPRSSFISDVMWFVMGSFVPAVFGSHRASDKMSSGRRAHSVFSAPTHSMICPHLSGGKDCKSVSVTQNDEADGQQ